MTALINENIFTEERRNKLLSMFDVIFKGVRGRNMNSNNPSLVKDFVNFIEQTTTIQRHPKVERMLEIILNRRREAQLGAVRMKWKYVYNDTEAIDELQNLISNLTAQPNKRALEIINQFFPEPGNILPISSSKLIDELRTIFESGGGVELKCELICEDCHGELEPAMEGNYLCTKCGIEYWGEDITVSIKKWFNRKTETFYEVGGKKLEADNEKETK